MLRMDDTWKVKDWSITRQSKNTNVPYQIQVLRACLCGCRKSDKIPQQENWVLIPEKSAFFHSEWSGFRSNSLRVTSLGHHFVGQGREFSLWPTKFKQVWQKMNIKGKIWMASKQHNKYQLDKAIKNAFMSFKKWIKIMAANEK